MSTTCTWPQGVCKCYASTEEKPDPYGRVWMHCEEGLSLTKASMSRFIMFVLENHIEIGSVYAFKPNFPRSLVIASIRIRPDQITCFERDTGGKLRLPPKIKLNTGGME